MSRAAIRAGGRAAARARRGVAAAPRSPPRRPPRAVRRGSSPRRTPQPGRGERAGCLCHSQLSAAAQQLCPCTAAKPRARSVTEFIEGGRAALESPGALVVHAEEVRVEMNLRLARATSALLELRPPLAAPDGLHSVRSGYIEQLQRLVHFGSERGAVDSPAKEELFSAELRSALRADSGVMRRLHQAMAAGAPPQEAEGDYAEADRALGEFAKWRTAWRLLADHHLALRGQLCSAPAETGSRVGVFHRHVRPGDVADRCFFDAQSLCIAQLGRAPRGIVEGDIESFEYIPGYLSFVLFELIKNALHATLRVHGKRGSLPDVVLDVQHHGGAITLSVRDEGGGIPEELLCRPWAFGFTTAAPGVSGGGARFVDSAQGCIAGYGFGLPLSRCLLEYLGGSLELLNRPGFGVDAVVTIPLAGSARREHFAPTMGPGEPVARSV
eukprot:TRINITY_DN50397_c0_g1_i1.p1 TRINITY_DN50397_c0_g1~~TRINITY_DN50397_c0_g1_i1.p1  ORF type:complete len:441 (+),score=113.28 TRINITY_DN50397_c0_g1_i1:96-1418(+)